MRILVTGSRDWEDWRTVCYALGEATAGASEIVIVSGGARGADHACEAYADGMEWGVEVHRADWLKFGKKAGILRNLEMIARGADVCLAFIRNDSRGATHCADAAEEAGIPVKRYVVNDIVGLAP